ncbi:MAG: RagB/SusD family nutrient uptake outer membrane protein [Bacteroidales bacterium]
MKNNKYTSVLAIASMVALGACSDIDDIVPEGDTMLETQLKATTSIIPGRADATFSGMYTKLGDPLSFGRFASERPDDFGFVMMAFSNDLEAADIVGQDNNYNWFSTCSELTTRNADYANPYIRYRGVYDEVARANDVIKAYGEITAETSAEIKYKVAQAYAVRAFCYLNIAPYFQFNYKTSSDKPCVPLVTETTTDFTNNPRATVKEIYDQIVSDLDFAIANLEGYTRPDKSKIDKQVAYGLRARANLDMGKYAEAASDAAAAAQGYTPASIAEVSTPSFYNITDHNWLWGYDMTMDAAKAFPYATSSAWIRSFSANGYSAGTGTYFCINNLLYNKIPESDVRKGWWVNTDLYSPLLDNLTFGQLKGQQIATEGIKEVKEIFLPYTNVKFGMYTIGGTTNEEDWPFMRVEEMLLIQAEGLIKSGQTAAGVQVLNDFVRTYRDPQYNAEATGRKIEDEVWFQRRVELWGEGFSNSDTRRLGKPLVRFHGSDSNWPEAFRFNMTADDGWWLLRFCTDELNTNLAIVDNEGGALPVRGQNASLRDGVTD